MIILKSVFLSLLPHFCSKCDPHHGIAHKKYASYAPVANSVISLATGGYASGAGCVCKCSLSDAPRNTNHAKTEYSGFRYLATNMDRRKTNIFNVCSYPDKNSNVDQIWQKCFPHADQHRALINHRQKKKDTRPRRSYNLPLLPIVFAVKRNTYLLQSEYHCNDSGMAFSVKLFADIRYRRICPYDHHHTDHVAQKCATHVIHCRRSIALPCMGNSVATFHLYGRRLMRMRQDRRQYALACSTACALPPKPKIAQCRFAAYITRVICGAVIYPLVRHCPGRPAYVSSIRGAYSLTAGKGRRPFEPRKAKRQERQ